MATHWRLLVLSARSGAWSMAVDRALSAGARDGISPPTLAFYSWPDSCLSLGRLQQTDGVLDADRCRADGVEVARRPTGGLAILHRPGDVTYGVAAPEGETPLNSDVMGSYRAINAALVRGLALLGVNASTRATAPVWPDPGVGFGCFEQAYRHEVYWAGRKIVASAQRRTGGAFLQQGVIPGTVWGADLAQYVIRGPGERAQLRRALEERTGTLERAMDRVPPPEEVAESLAAGFRQEWGIDLRPGTLTTDETRTADEGAKDAGTLPVLNVNGPDDRAATPAREPAGAALMRGGPLP